METTAPRFGVSFKIFLVGLFVVMVYAVSASADYSMEGIQLVEKSRFTLKSFSADSNLTAFQNLAKSARGIFIAPQVLKGAFIVGASGGSGVFVAWDEKSGRWNGPAFYSMGGVSFGFQIGGEASEVVLLVMTERGVKSLLLNSFKLGLDAGVAAGPIGMGASAASANFSVDILSFSRSKGLYGGVSLDGTVVAIRHALNEGYYGRRSDAIDILIMGDVVNDKAAPLIETIQKITGRK